jgi:hypothetical protein
MSVSAVIARVDDWINPIVVKELRQAVKSRMVVSILMLFLGLQLFLLGVFLLFREVKGEDVVNWNAGNEVFRWQQGILLVTLMLLVPAYAAIRLGAERSDHNVDLLFISTLHPRSIIAGKFFAALVLALLVFSTCAPFMTFTYLLRGIDIPTILTVLGIDLLGMLFGTMLALFVAAIPGGRAIKFFLAFLAFIFLGILCYIGAWATLGVVMEGASGLDAMFDFWLVLAVIVAAILGLVGLFFFYSVTLISPASSNRILPVRLYLLLLWVLMGVGLFLTSYHYKPSLHLGPIAFWVFGACTLVCIQFTISICERERWGPRMARAIPRSPLLRLPAFLLYTGSAGGILLSILLAAATLGSTWWWCDRFGSPGSVRGWEPATVLLNVMTVICLYTYCFGLSSVLVRAHVLGNQLKPSYTWLVGLLLVGLGSSIPSVIAYVFFSDQMRLGTDGGWWMLPNPFMAVYELIPGWTGGANDDFNTLCYWFLGTWAVLVTALSLPWFVAQVSRFHPPAKKREVEYAEVVVVEPAPCEEPPCEGPPPAVVPRTGVSQ